MLCRLVAHHSCALIEAAERGLADQLSREFKPARPDLTDALIYCDMTTGPNGQHMPVEQRLAEIRARYGPEDPVSRALARSAPLLTDAVAESSASWRAALQRCARRPVPDSRRDGRYKSGPNRQAPAFP
jgi:hypothetical protein